MKFFNVFLISQGTTTSGVINLRQFHVTKSSYTKRKYVFKLTNMAADTKPASPSPVPQRKTEFLFQADDQATYEQWKNRLEKVARPSEENVVSFSFLVNLSSYSE